MLLGIPLLLLRGFFTVEDVQYCGEDIPYNLGFAVLVKDILSTRGITSVYFWLFSTMGMLSIMGMFSSVENTQYCTGFSVFWRSQALWSSFQGYPTLFSILISFFTVLYLRIRRLKKIHSDNLCEITRPDQHSMSFLKLHEYDD